MRSRAEAAPCGSRKEKNEAPSILCRRDDNRKRNWPRRRKERAFDVSFVDHRKLPPPTRPTALDPLTYFTPEDLARGAQRAQVQGWTGLAELVVDVALLLAVAFGPLGRWLQRSLSRLPDRDGPLRRVLGTGWLQAAVLLASVAGLRQLLALPFVLWRLKVSYDLGLSHEPLVSWLGRYCLETLTLAAALALMGPVLSAVRCRWPRRWWLAVGAAGALALVGDALLEPYRTRLQFVETPLPEGPLLERLEALAAEHDATRTFTVVDASKYGTRANAFVTGFGPTRRIVLTDTLVKLGEDAVLGAVAHEIGHRRGERMPPRLALAALGLVFFLLFVEHVLRFARRTGSPTDAHAIAFLLVAVTGLNLVLLPVRAAFGRAEEREADALELSVRDDLDGYIRDQVSLARANALDPVPGTLARLLSDHPGVMERIERAIVRKRTRAVEAQR